MCNYQVSLFQLHVVKYDLFVRSSCVPQRVHRQHYLILRKKYFLTCVHLFVARPSEAKQKARNLAYFKLG